MEGRLSGAIEKLSTLSPARAPPVSTEMVIQWNSEVGGQQSNY